MIFSILILFGGIVISVLFTSYFSMEGKLISKSMQNAYLYHIKQEVNVKYRSIYVRMLYQPGKHFRRIERSYLPIWSTWIIEGVGRVPRGTELHNELESIYAKWKDNNPGIK